MIVPIFHNSMKHFLHFAIFSSVNDQASIQDSWALQVFVQLLVLHAGNAFCLAPSVLGNNNVILEHSSFCSLGRAHSYPRHAEPAVLFYFLCVLTGY